MCVFVHVCVHICVHTCMYTCMNVCVCMYVYAYVHACRYMYRHVWPQGMCAHMCVHVCMNVYACVWVGMCMYMRVWGDPKESESWYEFFLFTLGVCCWDKKWMCWSTLAARWHPGLSARLLTPTCTWALAGDGEGEERVQRPACRGRRSVVSELGDLGWTGSWVSPCGST